MELLLMSPALAPGGGGGGAACTHPRPTLAERGATGEATAGLYLIGPHSEAAPRPGRRVGSAPNNRGVWGGTPIVGAGERGGTRVLGAVFPAGAELERGATGTGSGRGGGAGWRSPRCS